MKIIDFNKFKKTKKEDELKLAYKNAIEIFGLAKFNEGVRFNITTHELTKLLNIIYDSYKEKKVIEHYQEDVICYLNNAMDTSIKNKNRDKITSLSLIDALCCPLYERRIEEGKKNNECSLFEKSLEKIIIKRNDLYGGKHN